MEQKIPWFSLSMDCRLKKSCGPLSDWFPLTVSGKPLQVPLRKLYFRTCCENPLWNFAASFEYLNPLHRDPERLLLRKVSSRRIYRRQDPKHAHPPQATKVDITERCTITPVLCFVGDKVELLVPVKVLYYFRNCFNGTPNE